MNKTTYKLPDLPYGYNELVPYISEEQLAIHHKKHHQAYVNNINAIFEKLEKARIESSDIDQKSVLKDLSFNVGGHVLHSIFWENMIPAGKSKILSDGPLLDAIKNDFGSIERFKKEFSQAALSVEGSGWSTFVYSRDLKRLSIAQIEKHNVNLYPESDILMALDMFEHAYYIDYKNDKATFVEAFWKIANWEYVEKRFVGALNKNA